MVYYLKRKQERTRVEYHGWQGTTVHFIDHNHAYVLDYETCLCQCHSRSCVFIAMLEHNAQFVFHASVWYSKQVRMTSVMHMSQCVCIHVYAKKQ
jgi:hypothetical protein